MIDMTLCFLLQGRPQTQLLLGRKKTGFGTGKYYGFGGKVEVGETITQATVREIYEESGLEVEETALIPMGQVYFVSVAEKLSATEPNQQRLRERQQIDRLGTRSIAHLFIAKSWQGEPRETHEMTPTWFDLHQVPYQHMWPTDKIWLRPVLAGQALEAVVTTYADGERVCHIQNFLPPTNPGDSIHAKK